MKSISGKEFCRAVERFVWVLLRVHGSHHIYAKDGSPVRLSIPVHGHRSLKIGLLRSLLKAAGLTEADI